MEINLYKDVHSFAEPEKVKVTHLDWNAKVDFDKHIIKAHAIWNIKKEKDAKQIIFDINKLTIHSITDQNNNKLAYNIGKEKMFLGQPLIVEITELTKKIDIYYESSSNAEALQWLNPQQTAGKKYPFLFSQSEAILARTWIPCQDSPGIKFTYTAKVSVPNYLLAVMSASNPQEKNSTGIYNFEMKQPIPSYLLALSVGDLKFNKISERTGIYAEPQILEKATWEFADIEKMLENAENLYGKYAWERFDVLVLPPSFPFGGMENPRITFATPTIITGDRSLTTLLAHELAHSWSGNLVSNATWNDFWLNEGFTVYFERRIMEAMYGKDYAEMLAVLGYQDLMNTINDIENQDKVLKLDLENRNPDDGMTDIAYEKGYFFLRMLEENVGRKVFDDFLLKYFKNNSFKTMITEDFIKILDTLLFKKDSTLHENFFVEQWVYGIDLPVNFPNVLSKRFQSVENLISSWYDGIFSLNELDIKNWSSHEWLYFLRKLPEDISLKQIQELDSLFNFTQSQNSEIITEWFVHTIKLKYEPINSKLEEFLYTVGRRKFLIPIYKALNDVNHEKALKIYTKSRENYHSIAVETLDEILHFDEK